MSPWDDPTLVERLKELASQKKFSAAQIARMLGNGISRSGVCGKLHRLGIQIKSTPGVFVPKKPAPKKSVAAVAPISAPLLAPPKNVVPIRNGELEPHHCKFPLGDPSRPDFQFCGADRVRPLPYCAYHNAVAFNAVAKKKSG